MATTLSTTLLEVQSKQLVYFAPNLSGPLTLNLPPSLVSDLEILDKDGLINLIKDFVQKNKLTGSRVNLILGENICFIQDFTEANPTELAKAKAAFLENVPFQNVASRSYKLPKGERLVAFNRSFFESIYHGLTPLGFTTGLVVPSFVLQKIIGTAGINAQTSRLVMAKIDSFKDDGFFSGHGFERPMSVEKKEVAHQYNFRMIILFVVLLLISLGLVVYYFTQVVPETHKVSPVINKPGAKVTKPTPSPTPSLKLNETNPSSPAASLSTTAVNIKIVNGSGVAGLAGKVEKQLNQAGFTNTQTETSETKSTQKTVIAFLPKVSQSVRQAILAVVQQILPDAREVENKDLTTDVLITTGTGKILP